MPLPASAAPYEVVEKVFDEPGQPRTVLRLARVDGRLELVNVEIGVDIGLRLRQEGAHIEEPAPLPAAATRLPLKRWTLQMLEDRARLADRFAAGEILKQNPAVAEAARRVWVPEAAADLGKRKRPPGRPGIPRTFLEDVARIYAEAHNEGLPPTKTVAERLHGSRSAAAKWVAKCRKEGLLDKTEPRRAGGIKTKRKGRR